MGLMDLLDEAVKDISDAVSTGVSTLAKALDLPDPDEQFPPESARIVPGNGGYVYAQYPDGTLVIKSGPNGEKDLKVKPGSKAWKAITNEIGEYSSQAAAAASPTQGPAENDSHGYVTRDEYISAFNDRMDQVEAKLAELQTKASTTADARAEYDRLWTQGQLMVIEYGQVLAEIIGLDESAVASATGTHLAKIDALLDQLNTRLKSAAATAGPESASLKVTVMDNEKRRVPGANVFMPYFGFSQMTGTDGLAHFTNLPAPFSPPIQASIAPVAGGSPYFTDEIWATLIAGENDPLELHFDRSLDELTSGLQREPTLDDMRDEFARISKRVDAIFDEYDFASTTK